MPSHTGEKIYGSKKLNVTSPTTATESFLIKSAIYMTENRYFAVIDAPGELLTIEQDEEVIVIIENDMVYSMLDINAELYCKYVII